MQTNGEKKILAVDIEKKIFQSPKDGSESNILENLRFTLNHDEFVCLTGYSGCGKTTLLNIVSGIDKKYTGRIDVFPNKSETCVSYMFQEPRLLPWRTVRQNIEIFIPPGLKSTVSAETLLEQVGMKKFQSYYPHMLSMGMARRVALARAFSPQPKILLMDEPFVSLDGDNADTLRKLLLQIRHTKRLSVLFVTHDINEAIFLSDRILVMEGSPARISRDIAVSLPRDQRGMQNILNFKLDFFG